MTESVPDGDDTPGHEPPALPLSPVTGDRIRAWAVAGTLLAAVAVIVAAQWGYAALLATVGVLALAVVAGGPVLGGSHTPTASSAVLALAGLAIFAATLTTAATWVAAAVALGIVASFLHQLLRPAPRHGLVVSLVADFGVLALLASGGLLVVLGHEPDATRLLVVGMLAVVVGVVGDLLVPLPRVGPFLGLVVLVLGIGVAALAGSWSAEVTGWEAVGIGAAAATVSWSLRRVFALAPGADEARAQVALGVGSVLLTGGVLRLVTLLA